VSYLINSSQSMVASYQYDAYGRTISSSGTLANANLYRFSSKMVHPASGLYYYGYRFYEPNLQRWLNRDPLGTSADFGTEIQPFEYYSGGNLYHFVYNNPINSIDPFGLDVWIIRDKCSKWGHEWVVGDNGDGTYWDSNKMPGKGPLAPANCPADIQFSPKSGFDPKNLNDPCLEIRRHVVTSPAVDKKVRDEAEKRAKEDKGRYDALGSNCRDYSQGMCDYAVGAKLRERLDKREGK
jgi:RHS repeat-associated protein